MRKFLSILLTSLKMAVQEFRSNKLRTLLSLLGVGFGIFCIISVLSTIGSLENAIQKDIKSLGTNIIYIDKWDYAGGQDYPWWKYVNRPEPKSTEIESIRLKVPAIQHIAFEIELNDIVEYESSRLTNVKYYGISKDFLSIQPVEITEGRTLQPRDFDQSANSVLIGHTIAEQLFGNAEKAIGRQVSLKGKKIGNIIGLIKKQGKSIMEIWDFDNSIIISNGYMAQMVEEKNAGPKLIVQGRPDVPMGLLQDELTGAMRSLRKLKPGQADNFTLNDIDTFSKFASDIFGNLNMGGWVIASLSLIVGMFGVANIMFVTVRERTSQIGLKKAIGAKRSTILIEFLLESAFLCILGGLIGLTLVFILTTVFSAISGFPIFISLKIMLLAFGICVVVGVLAGIIPASIAARMDPVVAIRSK